MTVRSTVPVPDHVHALLWRLVEGWRPSPLDPGRLVSARWADQDISGRVGETKINIPDIMIEVPELAIEDTDALWNVPLTGTFGDGSVLDGEYACPSGNHAKSHYWTIENKERRARLWLGRISTTSSSTTTSSATTRASATSSRSPRVPRPNSKGPSADARGLAECSVSTREKPRERAVRVLERVVRAVWAVRQRKAPAHLRRASGGSAEHPRLHPANGGGEPRACTLTARALVTERVPLGCPRAYR